MSTLNIGTTVQISGTNRSITGILSAEGIVPAGSVIFVARNSAPDGYLPCNGALLDTTIYSALFIAIGYNFGGSGGSFNLPDLRGEFVRGLDTGRGVDSGRNLGSFQADEFRSHQHLSTIGYTGTYGSAPGGGAGFGGAGGGPRDYSASAGGTETRPRNIALLACIKY